MPSKRRQELEAIDTTSTKYTNFLRSLNQLRPVIDPRLKVWVKLPFNKRREWLQRDPLLRAVVKLARDVTKLGAEGGELD